LAENGDGRWAVDIQAVQCPVGNTKLEYKFQGSNPWYLKIQVRNSRYVLLEQFPNPIRKSLKQMQNRFLLDT
jgi:expansin (peptidoglycan-binding protein)